LTVPEFDDAVGEEPPEAGVTGKFELAPPELAPTDPPPFEGTETGGRNTSPPNTAGEGFESVGWLFSRVFVELVVLVSCGLSRLLS
jgi:hypothetical protein